ncbi:hypothetical protein COY07_00160 [Candidatus Peregrinibacteria bacterium CG_4_10_14_0_2_um_filter_43_11]|nr:MAG: hypothetical protein COY07_00160 [Candidatus Peregrinibacteria bacterium CG_4_10_14_0_2_um_filter_43_11]
MKEKKYGRCINRRTRGVNRPPALATQLYFFILYIMKKTNRLIPVILAALVIVVTTSFLKVSANDDSTSSNRFARPQMQGQHQAIGNAIAQNDYDTWQSLMSQSPMADKMADKINQATFDKLVEAQKLAQSCDKEGAKAIFDELGLKGPRGGWEKGHQGDRPELTDEQKIQMKKAKELMKACDKEGAKAIFDELGLKGPRDGEERGPCGDRPKMTDEQETALKTALDNNDYQAWFKVVSEATPKAEVLTKINADNFSAFVELRKAKENKDLEGIKKLHEELGIEIKMPHPQMGNAKRGRMNFKSAPATQQ